MLPNGEDTAAGVGGLPDGDDPVVRPSRQVDDHSVGRRQRLVERGERSNRRTIGARGLDLGDEAGRPDEVVGEDEDAHARSARRQPSVLARWRKTSRAETSPVGRPFSTIGMWRKPPTAILLIATATVSS